MTLWMVSSVRRMCLVFACVGVGLTQPACGSDGGGTPVADGQVSNGDTSNPFDTGTPALDTQVGPNDTGFVPTDTATPPQDTGTPPQDTGTPPQDTGAPPQDTGTPPQDTGTPPQDTGTPPQDTGPVATLGAVGDACTDAADCQGGANAFCLSTPGGYCTTLDCEATPCAPGSTCFSLTSGDSACFKDCVGDGECRQGEGYLCDADNTCWTAPTTNPDGGAVGDACSADTDCADPGAVCYPAQIGGEATGFFEGYCLINDCTADSCPAGSVCAQIYANGASACVAACAGSGDCNQGYGCFEPGICFPSCQTTGCPANWACDATEDICGPACTADSCPAGTVCKADGTCGDPPCTVGSCPTGYLCATSGDCVPDLEGGPGPGPGPTCASVPAQAGCTSGTGACAQMSLFTPLDGPGYTNYPLNGETASNQYRSYCREDLQQLIKWAAAMVDCKAASWGGGNGHPIGLGDMSEADGAIPGASIGQPGHPPGTHEDGYDMDIAYYQVTSPNNFLRSVCDHHIGGQDAYRCVAPPDNLDIWRTAYFLGLLFQSPRTRVIGVDGQIGELVEQAFDVLCAQGWLTGPACTGQASLAYETVDEGRGWYRFHHHHFHISLWGVASSAPTLPNQSQRLCKVRGCPDMSEFHHDHGLPPLPRTVPQPTSAHRSLPSHP